MIISREVDINVNRYGLRVVIPVVQYDSGRQIIFNIIDAELPSGCTSNIFIRKPSGKSVYNACTVSSNKVTVTLTNQSISECGLNDAQVQVIKGEEVVTSFGFVLDVRGTLSNDAVISKTESTYFQGLVSKAQAVAKTCTEVAESIPDDYSTMSNKVNANTSAINTNKTAIDANTRTINTNKTDIATNKSAIVTNTSAINTNTSAINTNKTNIAANTAAINTNKTDIATNKAAIATNKAAINAVKTDLLGGYKLVGYTPSVVMDKAGEYIIPYPSGENFGTVYGILSATFLLGGYCLPYPPLTSSKSPSLDVSQAVAFRLLSTGIAIYTGGGWGAESRDIYFVLICKT